MNQWQRVSIVNGTLSDLYILVGLTLATILISSWFLVAFPIVCVWLSTISYKQAEKGMKR